MSVKSCMTTLTRFAKISYVGQKIFFSFPCAYKWPDEPLNIINTMSRDREHHEKEVLMPVLPSKTYWYVPSPPSFRSLPFTNFWMMKTYAHLLSQSYSIMIEAAVLFGLDPAFGLDWPVYLPVLCCLTTQKSIHYILPHLSLLLWPFANLVADLTGSIDQYQ